MPSARCSVNTPVIFQSHSKIGKIQNCKLCSSRLSFAPANFKPRIKPWTQNPKPNLVRLARALSLLKVQRSEGGTSVAVPTAEQREIVLTSRSPARGRTSCEPETRNREHETMLLALLLPLQILIHLEALLRIQSFVHDAAHGLHHGDGILALEDVAAHVDTTRALL